MNSIYIYIISLYLQQNPYCFEPLVPVRQGLAFSSIKSIIMEATFFPDAFSIPSSPGEEFTSIIRGPLEDLSISTPATFNPRVFAAATAVFLSAGVIFTEQAVPPR